MRSLRPPWRLRLLGQTGWLLASRLVGTISQLTLLVLLARATDVAQFGSLVAVLGVVQLSMVIADFGFGAHVMQRRAKAPNAPIDNDDMLFLLMAGVTFLTFTVLLWATLTRVGLPYHLGLLMLWGMSERFIETFQLFFIASEQAFVTLGITMIRRVGALACFIVLERMLSPTLAFAVSSLSATYCALALLASVAVRRFHIDLSRGLSEPFLELCRDLRPYYGLSVFGQLRALDVTIVGLAAGSITAGIYAVAARLYLPLLLIPSSLAQAALPRLVRASQGRLRNYSDTLLVFFAVSMIPALTVFVLAEQFVEIIGPQYSAAVEPVRVYCVGMIFTATMMLPNAYAQARGLAKAASRLSLVFGLSAVISIFWAASRWGALGAACCLSLTSLGHLLSISWLTIRDSLRQV